MKMVRQKLFDAINETGLLSREALANVGFFEDGSLTIERREVWQEVLACMSRLDDTQFGYNLKEEIIQYAKPVVDVDKLASIVSGYSKAFDTLEGEVLCIALENTPRQQWDSAETLDVAIEKGDYSIQDLCAIAIEGANGKIDPDYLRRVKERIIVMGSRENQSFFLQMALSLRDPSSNPNN